MPATERPQAEPPSAGTVGISSRRKGVALALRKKEISILIILSADILRKRQIADSSTTESANRGLPWNLTARRREAKD
jgi:hypothetical protein